MELKDLNLEILQRLTTIETKIDNFKRTEEQSNQNTQNLITLKMKIEDQEKEIEELKQKDKDQQKWILGIVASIISGMAVAVVRVLIGA